MGSVGVGYEILWECLRIRKEKGKTGCGEGLRHAGAGGKMSSQPGSSPGESSRQPPPFPPAQREHRQTWPSPGAWNQLHNLTEPEEARIALPSSPGGMERQGLKGLGSVFGDKTKYCRWKKANPPWAIVRLNYVSQSTFGQGLGSVDKSVSRCLPRPQQWPATGPGPARLCHWLTHTPCGHTHTYTHTSPSPEASSLSHRNPSQIHLKCLALPSTPRQVSTKSCQWRRALPSLLIHVTSFTNC